MNHHSLCLDLAADLRTKGYRTYVEIERVGKWSYGERGRIDVLAMTPWTGRTKFDLACYEVKLNRSDLQQDIRKGKWRRYVDEYGCSRVYFAFPESAGNVDDIPTDAGVLIWNGDKWVRKRAAKNMNTDQRKIDSTLLIAMLTDEHMREVKGSGAERNARRARSIEELYPRGEVEQLLERLKGIKDSDLAERVRYSLRNKLGKDIGYELARRLARTKNDEVLRVHDWARDVVHAVRFLSCEPLLEPLGELDLTGISWVIVGGESGPNARPCDPDWIRDIVRQCRVAGVAVFVKQMGSAFAKSCGVRSKGGDVIPEDLRIREFPEVAIA